MRWPAYVGAEPGARVELLQLGQRVVAAPARGRSVVRSSALVVDDDQARHRGVRWTSQLDPVGAELERMLEGGEGVFGTVAHRAAVADDPDAPALLVQTLSERQAFSGCLSHTIG